MSAAPPASIAALRGVRLASGAVVDIALDGDEVLAVVPAGTPLPDTDGITLDLSGYLVTAAGAEPHAHLDKSQSWDAIQPPFGDLERAIESWHAYAVALDEEDTLRRARSTALRMLASGITAVRTHVDLLRGNDVLTGVRAMVRLRDELAGLMDVELVALGGPTIADDVFEAALDAGVDLVGGAPHLADDPIADLERLIALARRRDVGLDLHTDESLAGFDTLAAYAAAVTGWHRPRTAGHCVRLSMMAEAELDTLADGIRTADIGIVALPITNLYLQGWGLDRAVPRGIAPIGRLKVAGVRVAAGADNVRDPFNPVGRCDHLETASLLVSAGHLAPGDAMDAVTVGARDVMGLPLAGPVAGARADLVAVKAASLGDAVAFASADRVVIHRGRLVSRTTVSTEIAASVSTRSAAPATAP
ncbi:amidohydrolase family protein [Microbacterium sp. VKM Ac-2923]|uniref:amidohydrolase family protein n=1 Tax=Microbacterium sp. VKM Ac-2923 TaxID=2929476 RepID=UPI001FB2660D|nr:amidohydrolase family protein [Microbacterium sp. VKM Ac-2923]MCJ1706093.1 amidohydrolase family protein [Microbacterium sp. VKM Ac-2923]